MHPLEYNISRKYITITSAVFISSTEVIHDKKRKMLCTIIQFNIFLCFFKRICTNVERYGMTNGTRYTTTFFKGSTALPRQNYKNCFTVLELETLPSCRVEDKGKRRCFLLKIVAFISYAIQIKTCEGASVFAEKNLRSVQQIFIPICGQP